MRPTKCDIFKFIFVDLNYFPQFFDFCKSILNSIVSNHKNNYNSQVSATKHKHENFTKLPRKTSDNLLILIFFFVFGNRQYELIMSTIRIYVLKQFSVLKCVWEEYVKIFIENHMMLTYRQTWTSLS